MKFIRDNTKWRDRLKWHLSLLPWHLVFLPNPWGHCSREAPLLGWVEGGLRASSERGRAEPRGGQKGFHCSLALSLSTHSNIFFYWASTRGLVLFRHREYNDRHAPCLLRACVLEQYTVTTKFKCKLIETKSNWKFSYVATGVHFKCSQANGHCIGQCK